jgi:cellulose synthase/poly-beta-1,6-N-acetylglucosamine synthase-like glycosyltransferase
MLEWILYALIIFYIDINYGIFFVSSLFPREERTHKIKKYPKVSVIIPTKNEGRVIGETLKKLKASDYPKNKLEIIIVDANSNDDTIKIAKKYTKNIIIEKHPRGKPNALNIGLEKTTGELIYFLDADNWVRPDTIKKLVSAMDKYNAATGETKVRNKTKLIENVSVLEIGIHDFLIRGLSRAFKIEIISGYNFIIRKSVLKKIGGFEDTLTEDVNMSLRIYKSGEHIALIDAPSSISVPKTIKSYWKQQERWRKGGIDEAIKFIGSHTTLFDAIVKMPFLCLSTIVCTISPILLIAYIIFGNLILLSGAIMGFLLIISSVAFFDKKQLIYLPAAYIYYTILEIANFLAIFAKIATGKKFEWYKTPK